MASSGGTSARFMVLACEVAMLVLQRLMSRSIRTGLYVKKAPVRYCSYHPVVLGSPSGKISGVVKVTP